MKEDQVATVQDLIDYLEKSFKPEDRLCFWHEGGAWIECEHLPKSDLGRFVFHTVKSDKDDRLKNETDPKYIKQINDDYKKVNDYDIIVW